MLQRMTINAILKYIEDNIESVRVDINKLVRYSGYSRRYLQLLFKKHMGKTLGEYIQLRRVTRAAVLLRLTKLSINSVSERLLYDSQQTFTREFKKHTGYTPLQYRKMVYGFFQKITDYREIDEVIYKPKLCYINACNFTARGFSYKENFPFFHSSSSARWNFIDSLLENNESVTISHKINPCNDDNAHINMLVWNGDLDMNTHYTFTGGIFAYFYFKGGKEDYRRHSYNIYTISLPFYNLYNLNIYDLERITKLNDGYYLFEHYIPLNHQK
ncbi:TPA: helix-turn-helix transcriptional regulator [Escherichia coli]|uniref:helix-turn-helix transcriptional regulator n=1 Tax=Escherichia coli TaxID=562 RepID=UPI000BDE6D8A|nr:helix-turn-helix transcriptional regulator [Escherichia coli]EEQ2330990.1 helix-turn-helix transcriptional regulator [Escherichia coli]EEQ2662224.1 helix-turn-helix transcriptional regulator [Escherichia coli]EET0804119.1 helix-turn-helix transcriptional regulator [Escherichia coli]EFH6335705.1 helix-turn-helix domain-containing protein [Escherichia coli]EFH6452361.1 helix-turn-helix domain-containing protein [Escherichia coli]